MQFSGLPRNIGNPCSAPLTNTTRVHAFHALLLPFSTTKLCPEYHIYFMVRRLGHS